MSLTNSRAKLETSRGQGVSGGKKAGGGMGGYGGQVRINFRHDLNSRCFGHLFCIKASRLVKVLPKKRLTFHKQGGFTPSASSESTPAEPPKPAWTPAAPRKPTSSKAMKLGGNARDVDSFVDQLESEGVKVGSVGAPVKTTGGLNKVLHSVLVHF